MHLGGVGSQVVLEYIQWPHSGFMQQICRFLFDTGPSTLREVGMGTGLPKSVVSKGLMVLIQHSFIEALLHDQLGENRRIISNTVYKVRSVCVYRCSGAFHPVLTSTFCSR